MYFQKCDRPIRTALGHDPKASGMRNSHFAVRRGSRIEIGGAAQERNWGASKIDFVACQKTERQMATPMPGRDKFRRRYNGRKKDGALKGRRYKCKFEERAGQALPLRQERVWRPATTRSRAKARHLQRQIPGRGHEERARCIVPLHNEQG